MVPTSGAANRAETPSDGVIFGTHDYRDALKKAVVAVLSPNAKTLASHDFRHRSFRN